MSNAARNIDLLEGYLIEQTAKKMKQSFARKLSKANIDITVDQWIVLDRLRSNDALSQLDIAEATGKDAPTITRILDLLEKKKMVQRKSDLEDRRKFKIHLSPKGKKNIEKIKPLAIEFRTNCYKGLNSNQLDLLRKSLFTIQANLQKK